MAITWGAYSGKMRVGIDIREAGHSGSLIDIYVDVYVQCEPGWNFADNQRVDLAGSFVNTGWDFYNNLGAGQTRLMGTVVLPNQGQSYGGGPSYSWTATLSGNYLGPTASHSRGYTLPALAPAVPNPPTSGPAWSSVTAVSAFLDWGDTSNANGSNLIEHNLQVSRNNGFTDLITNEFFGGASSRALSGFAPGVTYWARARVRNGVGWSGWSAVTSNRMGTFDTGTPSVSNVAADAATVNWSAPSGGTATGYEVQWARNSAFTSAPQSSTGSTWATSLRIAELTPGSLYYVRVRSRTSTGYGSWSPATSFTTTAFGTSAPTITDLAPDAATANWATPSGAVPTGYELQWARDAGFTSALQSYTSTSWGINRRITGLTPGVRYYVRVRSSASTGYGAWSPTTSFETLSGAKVRKNGVWVDAPVFVLVGGQWKVAKVYKRVNGVWVL